jgi:hypothetical protein
MKQPSSNHNLINLRGILGPFCLEAFVVVRRHGIPARAVPGWIEARPAPHPPSIPPRLRDGSGGMKTG